MNSYYNPLNVLRQSPEAIKNFVLLLLAALIVRGTITMDAKEVALWGNVLNAGLEMMYVRPAVKARTVRELNELRPAPRKRAPKGD